MSAEFGSPRNLSILEYLEYFGCMSGFPRQQRAQRIRDVCELTDLRGREHVPVKGLSTGNRQRLLPAKTLLHDPELLLLDEPASGPDPCARNELRSIVRTLASMGKTIIISSHILPDIEEISDSIGIMEAGRLVLDGNIESLRQQHQTTTGVTKVRVPPDQMNQRRRSVGPNGAGIVLHHSGSIDSRHQRRSERQLCTCCTYGNGRGDPAILRRRTEP